MKCLQFTLPLIIVIAFLATPAGLVAEDIGASAAFQPIFNGKDLTGWVTAQGKPPKGMSVKNGELVAGKGTQTFYTEEEYEDYILRFEFKLPSGGNSGIAVRAPKMGDKTVQKKFWFDPAYTSVEVQLLDDHHKPHQRLGPTSRHGAAYAVLPITKIPPPLKKPGQWNKKQIRVQDSRLQVTLNGVVILDGDMGISKVHWEIGGWCNFKPGVGAARARGSIAIMNPTPGIAFRNLEVQRLPRQSRKPQTPDNTAPDGFVALFNGTDISGWQGQLGVPYDNPRERNRQDAAFVKEMQAHATKKTKNWQVDNGTLVCSGKGRGLNTVADYRDFELHLAYRLSSGGDSGLMLRETPQLQLWDAGAAELKRYGADRGSGAFWFSPNPEFRFPLARADKPAGEWNHLFVRMVRDRVSVWLNDELVLNGARIKDFWNNGAPVVRDGGITLVGSSKKAEFKNIYLRELKP